MKVSHEDSGLQKPKQRSLRTVDKYSYEERINYYSMLNRMKELKQVHKKMRQLIRGDTNISVEADGFEIKGYIDEMFSFASEHLYPTSASLADDNRNFYENLISAASDEKSRFEFSGYDNIWKLLKDWLPKEVDLPWFGYLLIVAIALYRSRSKADDVIIMAQYCLVLKLSGKSLDVLALVMPVIATQRFFFRKSEPIEGIEIEAASDVLFQGRSDCADFIESHFMKSVREIVLIIASYHLFPKSVAKHLYLWMGKVDRPKSLPEAVSKIVTDIANLMRMGESVIRGNPLSDVFLTSDPVMSAKKKSQDLLYSYNHIYYGLPTPEGVDSVTWVTDARKVISTITDFSKTVNPYDMRLAALNIAGLELTKKLLEVNAKRHRTRRMTPFLIIICGSPGIGKSTLTTWACQLWSRVMGREFQQTHVFEKNPQSEYNDGYVPGETPIIHISEIGSLSQKLAEAGMEKGVFELTSIVDSLPYAFNMSDVKDKGVTFCIPEMVCVDTNNPEMNLKFLVQNPSAYKRRGIYIVPEVKPEYRVSKDVCMLDGTKTADDYMDKWTFSVYRHRPIDNKNSIKEVILDNKPEDDIYRLYDVMKHEMQKHVATESAVLARSLNDWCLDYEKKIAHVGEKEEKEPEGPSDPVPPSIPVPPPVPPLDLDEKGDSEVDWIAGVTEDMSRYSDQVFVIRNLPSRFHTTVSFSSLTLPTLCDLVNQAFTTYGVDERPSVESVCSSCLSPMQCSYDHCSSCLICQTLNLPLKLAASQLKKTQSSGECDEKECMFSPQPFKGYVRGEKPYFSVKRWIQFFNSGMSRKYIESNVGIHEGLKDMAVDHKTAKRLLGDDTLFCSCCPNGSHVVPWYKKFGTSCRLFSRITAKSMKFFIFYFVLWVYDLAHTLRSMDAVSLVSSSFSVLVSIIYVPYSIHVLVLLVLLYTLLFVYRYVTGGDSLRTMALKSIRRELSYVISDGWSFLCHKQRFIGEISVVVVSLYGLSKVIPLVYSLFNRKKKRVESDFRTQAPSHTELKAVEVRFGMKAPSTRIKSKLGTMTYENVLANVDRPLMTNGSFEDFCVMAERNARPIKVVTTCSDKIITRKAFGYGIKGTFMSLPLHMFDFDNSISTKLYIAPDKGRFDKEGNYDYPIVLHVRPSDISQVATDVGIVKVSGTQFKDMTKHFPSDSLYHDQMETYISDFKTRSSDIGSIQANDSVFNRIVTHDNVIQYAWPDHSVGACGYPIFVKVNGGFFVSGVHIAGDNKTQYSYGIKIDRKALLRSLEFFETGVDFAVASRCEDDLKVDINLESRSFAHFIESGPVEIHGKVHTFNGNQKTNIVKSVFGAAPQFAETMLDLFPECVTTQYAPASMRPTKSGSPITNGAIKLCSKRKCVDKNVMDQVVNIVTEKIISNLCKLDIRRDYSPIDIQTVMNGDPYDYLSRPVDLSKSGGFGFPGKKKNHVFLYDVNESTRQVEPGVRLAEEVAIIVDNYSRGVGCNPIFKAALKDEVRPIEKVRKHKTRVFYATDFPFLIVQKSFMSPLYTLMIEHSKAFYAALGVDMHKQGHLIRESMSSFCEERKSSINMGEGDYGGFDTSMPYEIGEAACTISYRLLKWMGYNAEQLKIVSGLLTDLMFPRVDFFGDLLTVPGLQPSGKYATAEDNSLRNLVILVYSWYINPKLKHLDFFQYVLPITYGDDMLAAITDDVKDEFNNVSISRECAIIGLEFTSSSKSAILEPFVKFDEISFLKRTFAYHPDLDRYVSRLSLDSIYKILEFIEPTIAVAEHVQYDGICRSALIEFFFWSNRTTYNAFKAYIVGTLTVAFPDVRFNLPSYDGLCDDYRLT